MIPIFRNTQTNPIGRITLSFSPPGTSTAKERHISPGSGLNGFGYLDVIRKVYTNLPASEKADVYPTENQLARINHLYPQNYRVLERLRENEDLTTGSLAEDDKLESKETYILEEANVYLGGSVDPSFTEEGVTATADQTGDPESRAYRS